MTQVVTVPERLMHHALMNNKPVFIETVKEPADQRIGLYFTHRLNLL
jgi:hypothetical protein